MKHQQPIEVKKNKKPKDSDSIIKLLSNLGELKENGILTEKEFTDKKKELLSRI
jgi:hypothetical protein